MYRANLITRHDVYEEKPTPATKVTLDQADLTEADLRDFYLANSSLKSVVRSRAQLVEADSQGSDLTGSILRDANLEGADLSTLTMPTDYVSRSTLEDADLEGANLEGVDLEGADLEGAMLDCADLRQTRNLEQEQIQQAEGDESTQLPENLDTPESWIE